MVTYVKKGGEYMLDVVVSLLMLLICFAVDLSTNSRLTLTCIVGMAIAGVVNLLIVPVNLLAVMVCCVLVAIIAERNHH